MILEMWVKIKFVLYQPCYYNLLMKKRKLFANTDILLRNFSSPNLNMLVIDQIRWKQDFEKFWFDHYAGDIENKNIAGKY